MLIIIYCNGCNGCNAYFSFFIYLVKYNTILWYLYINISNNIIIYKTSVTSVTNVTRVTSVTLPENYGKICMEVLDNGKKEKWFSGVSRQSSNRK